MNRFLRKLRSVIFFVFLCGSGFPVFSANFIPADHPYIQYFGRWDFTNPLTPSHSWPGVTIYAEFEGTSIGVKLSDNFTYFNVFIDGGPATIFKGTQSSATSYTLATGLAQGSHTILFSKRCETTWTSFPFLGFLLDDGKNLLPPAGKPVRKIEFIGDSFTSASGNEYTQVGKPPDGIEQYTNIDKGFGPLIARHYNAQYHMTSVSGLGMVMDWQGAVSGNIPDRFDWTHCYTAKPEWDFEKWIPNLVVIGLGLNDYSGFGGWQGSVSNENTDLFKSRYHEFIATIRDVYPGVKILAVATHVEWMRTTIAQVVGDERALSHDDVFYAQYSYYTGGYVNEGHPNVQTHAKIADELIAAIDTINAWEPYHDTIPPTFTKLPETSFTVYDTLYILNAETDTYATVRYSNEDKYFDQMEHTFTTTGKRKHSVTLACENGMVYTYYLRAADAGGNAMNASAVVSFDVDTLQAPIRWFDPVYPIKSDEWKNGATPLGFGVDGVTEISVVNAAYFRKTIDLADPSAITYFSMKVKYDDGAVVYLNGTEIGRVNMGSNGVAYDSSALKSDKGLFSATLAPEQLSLLRKGQNLLAVEIHQFNDAEQDMLFDCRLITKSGGQSEIMVDYGSEWECSDVGASPRELTKGTLSSVRQKGDVLPTSTALKPNYPNPFNPVTTLSFTLSRSGSVRLSVFDLTGRKVRTLIDKKMAAGAHKVQFNGSTLPSGEYLCRLQCGDFSEVRKMVIMK
jgi:hypothetical protein